MGSSFGQLFRITTFGESHGGGVGAQPVRGRLAVGTQALGAQQREIADVAGQLQAIHAPLPATAHAALAKAYVVLDHPQQAQANIDAALRLNPGIRINPRVLQAARARNAPRTPEH